ncbi:ABC transporter substrate-binding protein [Nocardia goodfellowii]|uniref:ABC-type branched-subunit amino acid transport system substrate-binding protein n=1 Tax=Nocardia goodfellowii TaxID=882446 RepID=A0ABS4QLN6_9NOCA|nr:ABC transporter substrate-binding protein [Nocardia goodfellowii]MBP2192619.1 ABC-type branched-subunit amino acid transport system substrate-binding protein [Nocardia goodfellowii]
MNATDAAAVFKQDLRSLVVEATAAGGIDQARLAESAHVDPNVLTRAITVGYPLPTVESTRAIVTACLALTRPGLMGEQLDAELSGWEQRLHPSPDGQPPDQQQPRPWWGPVWARIRRYPRVGVAIAVTVAVALAAVVIFWPEPESPCVTAGLSLQDGECIGVTDGAFTGFDEASQPVVEQIARQNAEVGENYVTVAIFGPLSQPPAPEQPGFRPGQLDSNQAKQMLIGAATAQARLNTSRVIGDPQPRIRLLLANPGSYQTRWSDPIQELIDTRGDSDQRRRVVAVVALGTSVVPTRDAAKKLSEAKIPIVGAITTADDLNYTNTPGMLRATPTTSDYVAALARHLTAHPPAGPAMVVWDQNSEDRGDLYTGALQKAFRDQLGGWIGDLPDQAFVGATLPGDTWPQIFDAVTINICQSGAAVILYAGRVTDLPAFLESLKARRGCRDRPLTIMSGVAALTVIDRGDHEELRKAGLSIVYAGVTDPHTWPHGQGNPPEGWPPYAEALTAGGYRVTEADGYTCLTHDALLTATRAIRLASPNRVPQSTDVISQLRNINGAYTIPGCSGTLSFTTTSNGAPLGTSIQIVSIPR